MDGYSLMFCVIKHFDLVTKRSLAIDACTSFNHRKVFNFDRGLLPFLQARVMKSRS